MVYGVVPSSTLSVRVPDSIIAAMKAEAEALDRPVSWVARIWLEAGQEVLHAHAAKIRVARKIENAYTEARDDTPKQPAPAPEPAKERNPALTRASQTHAAQPASQAIVTKAEAKAAGAKTYFTKQPCPRGHIAPRYVSSAECLICVGYAARQAKAGRA